MKTNIKLRVTPEQSEAVQNICFANGVFWYAGNGSEVKYTEAKYLFIDSDRVWFRVITDHNIGTETEGYTEVDADLFIKTNGTCEEDKKEIDLRNTWCYATVPNHDRLRLLGYAHEPIGACKEYYYIDTDNKINDFENYPDGNQIRLNKQGKFEYATLSSQQGKSECQFAKYGFEKPDFECEILKEYNDHLVGAVYQNEKYFGTSWNKQGTCIQTKGFGYINMDLTPIKKPWYETCKFPALVWDEDNDLLVIRTRGEYTALYLNACIPLTNDEIEELKQ